MPRTSIEENSTLPCPAFIASTSKVSEDIGELAYKAVTNFSYRCPLKDCQKSFKNQLELHNHISACHKNVENFSCQYCDKIIKSQRYYVCHLKNHDPFSERFFCYMNDFKNSSSEVVKMHIENNHKESTTKQIFYHSKKQDPNRDLIIVCPTSFTQNNLKSFYQSQIDAYSIHNSSDSV